MPEENKINVLVIPDLFPKFKDDIQGVFVLDYLRATEDFCRNSVLIVRLTGKKGLTVEKEGKATVYRYSLSEGKVNALLKPFFYLLWFIKGYSAGKKMEQVDLIHAHGTILSGTLGYLLARKLKKSLIITEHQGPFSKILSGPLKRKWTRSILEKADLVLVVSKHLEKEIRSADIRPKKIIVTHNPVDTDLFIPPPSIHHPNNILFAARLDVFKGALRSLKAFHSICHKYPHWKFTIAGEGEELPVLQRYLKEHPDLREKVLLRGKVNKLELAAEMKTASFLVSPSMHESFGLVIAEALSCGLPVIAPDVTAPKEFVNEERGFLVRPDDIGDIALAMEKMILEPQRFNSTEIRKYMIGNFSIKVFGSKLKDIYDSLLDQS